MSEDPVKMSANTQRLYDRIMKVKTEAEVNHAKYEFFRALERECPEVAAYRIEKNAKKQFARLTLERVAMLEKELIDYLESKGDWD